MRHLFFFLAAAFFALTASPAASAASDAASLGLKAQRYFDQREWSSATAIYSLLIEQCPDSAGLYGRAITAAGMRGAEAEQQQFLRRALKERVPVDSVFSSVEHSCFALGRARLFEDFLILSARSEPWLSRKIDALLLDYYTFRRNGSAMVEYADKMLAGMPDSEFYILRRAEGLLIMGRREEARADFARAAAANPRCLTALLFLGEMAVEDKNPAAARGFLRSSAAIDPAPALAAAIDRLSAGTAESER